MKALDKQAWAAACNLEYLGFKQQEVFKVVKPEPGVRIHDTITRLEWKITENSLNAKCVYAQEGANRFRESASGILIYSPVLKAMEARFLLALAAAEGAKVIKTDTKQAYL
jgi:hypothetical protein